MAMVPVFPRCGSLNDLCVRGVKAERVEGGGFLVEAEDVEWLCRAFGLTVEAPPKPAVAEVTVRTGSHTEDAAGNATAGAKLTVTVPAPEAVQPSSKAAPAAPVAAPVAAPAPAGAKQAAPPHRRGG